MIRYFILAVVLLTTSSRVNFKDYNNDIEKVKKRTGSVYNNNYCILIDYSIHSGLNRGFLVNLGTNRIEDSFLVMHGKGGKFSNVPNTNNTSLGIAVIKERGYSKYGNHIKYTLIGLDKSNSNIKRRSIVLHSSKYAPNFQIYPINNGRSSGCPTVSMSVLSRISKIVESQKNKKILIYSFK
jgi:hypothetical protein